MEVLGLKIIRGALGSTSMGTTKHNISQLRTHIQALFQSKIHTSVTICFYEISWLNNCLIRPNLAWFHFVTNMSESTEIILTKTASRIGLIIQLFLSHLTRHIKHADTREKSAKKLRATNSSQPA